MLFANGDRIVFTGDSTTDAGRARPIGEGIHVGVGEGYVRQIENYLNVVYPEDCFRITNTGISGNTSRDLKNRWDTDVLALHPDFVSVMIGINDVWRQFDSPAITDSHVYPEEYRENLTEMLERTIPQVKGVVLMSPFYMEPCRDDFMRRRTDEYVRICRELSEKYPCIYVDLQQVFDEYLQHRHSSFIAWDRVHPGHIGSLLIARAFLKAVGADRPFV